MPTVLLVLGWRFFFYANEANEPVHIHCQKGEKECKYWLKQDIYDIELGYSFKMTSKDHRIVRKIVFDHFDYIIEEWNKFFREQ